MIKQAIKDVLARLATAVDADGATVFAAYTLPTSVAVYNNQLAAAEDGSGYDFMFPGAFVEVMSSQWELLGGGFSTTDLVWRIHIAHQELDAMDGTMNQNLDVFDIRDSIKDVLTLFSATNCSQLQPFGEQEDYKHGNVYHLVISFKCSFIDTAGSVRYITKQPPVALEMDVAAPEYRLREFDADFDDNFG